MLAFAGGTGWKQREPFLMTARLGGGGAAGEAEWQAQLGFPKTGFYDSVSSRAFQCACLLGWLCMQGGWPTLRGAACKAA